MRERTIGLALILIAFSALSAFAVYEHGVVGIFERCLSNSATITLFVDLTIALTMVMIWMWRDASARGASALPYVLLTLTLGSVGPLLYLLMRRDADVPASAGMRAHAARVS